MSPENLTSFIYFQGRRYCRSCGHMPARGRQDSPSKFKCFSSHPRIENIRATWNEQCDKRCTATTRTKEKVQFHNLATSQATGRFHKLLTYKPKIHTLSSLLRRPYFSSSLFHCRSHRQKHCAKIFSKKFD